MKRFVEWLMSIILFVSCFLVPLKDDLTFSDGYNGSSYIESIVETVDYKQKTETNYSISGGVPKYYNMGSNTNTCANVAGAIVLGYYDKFYSDIIPDFTSSRTIKNKTIFYPQSQQVQKVIDELHLKMKTNTSGAGTTENNFRTGLEAYIKSRNRNITYCTLSSGTFNENKYINAINEEVPVALFLSKYTLIPIGGIVEKESQDILNEKHYGGNHVVIGYGIKKIDYFDDYNVLIKSIMLLQVAMGYEKDSLSYLLLDDHTYLYNITSIKIF